MEADGERVSPTIKEIFSLKVSYQISELTKEPGYLEEFAEIKLPSSGSGFLSRRYSLANINRLYDKTASRFEFDDSKISKILEIQELSPKMATFYGQYILISFAAFVKFFPVNVARDPEEQHKCCLLLLNALRFDSKNKDVKAIQAKAFIDLYQLYLSEDFDSPELYPIVQKFFTENQHIGQDEYHILARHFAKVVKSSPAGLKTPNAVEMLNFWTRLLADRKLVLYEQTKILLKETVEPYILALDTMAVTFYTALVFSLPQEIANEIANELPRAIVNFLSTQDRYFKLPENRSEQLCELSGTTTEISFRFTDDTSSDGEKLSLLNLANEPLPLNALCSVGMISRLAAIVKSTEIEDQLMAIFVSGLVHQVARHEESPYYEDLVGTAVCYCALTERPTEFPILRDLMFKSFLFDPHYIVYDCSKEEFACLGAARDYCLQVILRQGADAITPLLKHVSPWPGLYAEVCERLVRWTGLLKKCIISDKSVLRSLCVYAHNFRHQSKYCSIARMAAFQLLDMLFEDSSISAILFNDQMFLSLFLSSMFSKAERPMILQQISTFIKTSKCVSMHFCGSIEQIIRQVCQSFPDPRGIDLICDLFASLFSIFDAIPSVAPEFMFMVQIFCESAAKIDKKYFDFMFNYMKYLPDVHAAVNVNTLTNAILNDVKLDIDDSLYDKLLDTITVKNKIIERASFISILLKCFWPKRDEKIVSDLVRLCCVHSGNAAELHRCGLDLFLINDMKKNRKCNNNSLELLGMVASSVSSPVVVQNFVSLLCPNEDGKVVEDHKYYVQFLNEMIMKNYDTPISYLDSGISVPVTFDSPLHRWAFAGWIFCESDDRLSLLKLSNGCELYTRGCLLYLDDVKSECPLPIRQWFLLVINVTSDKITVTINNDSSVIMMCLRPVVSATVFDGEVNRGKIGCFGFFSELTRVQAKALLELGPRMADEPVLTKLVYYTPKKISEYRSTHTKDAEKMTFADVLLKVCRIELILPLFAQMESIDDGSREPVAVLYTALALLRNALLLDSAQQAYFADIEGFSIVRHLLLSSGYKHLTYDLYLKFYQIAKELADTRLRNQLIKDILISFDMWVKSESFVSIVEHWRNVLFREFSSVTEILKPDRIFNLMRLYLWYERTDDFAKDRQLTDQQVRDARMHLHGIITERYGQLDTYSFLLLISHALTLRDDKQVGDILILLLDLVEHIREFMTSTESFVGLAMLILSRSDQVVSRTISLINRIHQLGVTLDLSLAEHMKVLFKIMKMRGATESLIKEFVNLIQGDVPELFELGTYMVVETTKELADWFYYMLHPSPKFCTGWTWNVWAIYAAITFESPKIYTFLIRCSPKQWKNNFCAIQRVCIASGRDPDERLHDYLMILAECIASGECTATQDFFDLVKFFIFFRRKRTHNPVLMKMMGEEYQEKRKYGDSSRIVGEWNDFVMGTRCLSRDEKMKLDHDVESVVIDSDLDLSAVAFGLRAGPNCEWLDLDLAKITMSLYEYVPCESAMVLCFFLSLFVVKHDEDFALRMMAKMDAGHKYIRKYVVMMEVFNHFRDQGEPNIEIFTHMMRYCEELTTDMAGAANILVSEYRHAQKRLLRKSRALFSSSPHLLLDYGLDQLRSTIDSVAAAEEAASKQWKLMWSNMTIDHAPWNYKESEHHYIRDRRAVVAFCPMLTRINRHFDIYRHASEMRDSGAVVEVAEKPKDEKLHPLEIQNDLPKPKETLVATDETYKVDTKCHIITVSGSKESRFCLGKDRLKIGNKVFHVSDIAYIFWRRFKFQPTGLEIFFSNGKTFLLDFETVHGNVIAERIASLGKAKNAVIQRVPFAEFLGQYGAEKEWVEGRMSNFEYLMTLNTIGGRSFNDPSQYPLVPWVISDYESDNLNLDDPSIYRDLNKPVGALGEERINELLQRLDDLRCFGMVPFLYSAYSSSPLSTFLYMIRMEPFTYQHILIQGGRFDTPYRIFFSIPNTYKSVLTQTNDYRELIPEFYFQPEFLYNLDGFDLGKVDGVDIGPVQLPPWANTPLDFIYMNRKALESHHVSSNLHHWIDLVFGYRQRGEEAEKSHNIFKEEMYDDIWTKPDATGIRRAEIEVTIREVGQVPPQLFTDPHRQRRLDIVEKSILEQKSIINLSPDKFIFVDFQQSANQPDKCTILALSMNAGVQKVDIVLGSVGDIKFTMYDIPEKFPEDIQSVVPLSHTKFAALCNQNLEAVCIDGDNAFECHKITNIRQKITAISSCDGILALSSDDARTHVYKPNVLTERFSIPTYRNSILCSCISRKFGVVVSGTDDCALIVGSIDDGSTIRVIKLQAIPQKVLITPSWGFIVVNECCYVNGRPKYSISVFNINGLHIRTVPFSSAVRQWVSWSNTSGFDFVIAAGDKGKLYGFEAFFADIKNPFYRCQTEVICMYYSTISHMVCAATCDGRLHFIPCCSQDFEKFVCK